jgi:hypothetical protein
MSAEHQFMGTVLLAMTGAPSNSVYAGDEISASQPVFAVAHLSTGSRLNIRTKPKTTAPVIARLRNGDRVPLNANACFNAVTGKPTSKPRSSPNVWCEVIIEGDIIAYARAKYFEPIN